MLLPLLLVVCASAQSPQSYYFSTSAIASDSNPGTDPSKPWRSLAMARNLSNQHSLLVLLERGSLWVDEPLVIALMTGGQVAAYGNESLPQPTIQFSRSAKPAPVWGQSGSVCLQLLDPHGTTVQQIHFTGCWTGVLLLFSPGARPRANVSVEGCVFSDIRLPYGSIDPAYFSWGRAIAVDGTGSLTNLFIGGNVAIRVDSFVVARENVDNLWINANTVEHCGGNCVDLEATNMRLSNSVFLRDSPEQLFLYGTTDVIIGTVTGTNVIENNDFNLRGEYEAAPDGCAIDFETAATGFVVRGNTIYRSWGGGIMVFGHDSTSSGLSLSNNSFIYAGCVQPRDDHGSIALMCPGGHIPSGVISYNNFVTCPNQPPIYVNPGVSGCANQMKLVGNRVNQDQVVDMPELSFNPVSSDSAVMFVNMPVLVKCTTPGATIRYTLDGSRPTESSPVFPSQGIPLIWPGPVIAVNVRAFHPGMLPSITNGVVVERDRYFPIPLAARTAPNCSFDGVTVDPSTGVAIVRGWVVDPTNKAGWGPSTVTIRITGLPDVSVLANVNRPDLVVAGVAPNPQHGFEANVGVLKGDVVVVDVFAQQTAFPSAPVRINGAPMCVCKGAPCAC